jgi:lipoprotein-releasing system ATP-binding protein
MMERTVSDVMLEAQNVHKAYRMGSTQVSVLKGADLTVRSGEFLAVIGASGSGKSTLLHLFGGLDRADQGSVLFRGKDLTRLGGRGLNRFRNQDAGFVFQFYHLLDELNILENVLVPVMAGCSVGAWFSCRAQAKSKAEALLERMGLKDRLAHKPYQLSGGERQRVAIARALINDPVLLLADEPTGNLDSATGNSILEIFEQLNKDGQTIVMVTHDSRISQQATRTITLMDGKIEECVSGKNLN